ncbi:hypothetical protein BV898_14617 [Hypsibius exemplaris]|uniref:Uncharacterized protein n=1 Tax=Hypsibius exemplaris TaxID=2072580 RepID=A0A9X6RJQ6_HYPEX|nr:hypothetical protein BV898_14617 [Hypsibius exemplaris]
MDESKTRTFRARFRLGHIDEDLWYPSDEDRAKFNRTDLDGFYEVAWSVIRMKNRNLFKECLVAVQEEVLERKHLEESQTVRAERLHRDSPVPIVIFIDLSYPDSAPDDKDRKGGRNNADLIYEAVDCVRKNPKMCEPNISIEVSYSQQMQRPRDWRRKRSCTPTRIVLCSLASSSTGRSLILRLKIIHGVHFCLNKVFKS